MSFPLLFKVGLRVHQTSAVDAFGDPIEAWATPVARDVYGWGAPQTSEPKLAGHNRDVVEIELLVPPGFACSARDRIILDFNAATWTEDADIEEFDVIGEPEHYDHNPFGWNPGGIVNLKAVRG